MTNEQICDIIAAGGADELLPLLWDKTRKLFYIKANSYYTKHKALFDNSGSTLDDMRQVCYFAMLEAIKGYSKRPENQKELPFTAYIDYPVMNEGAKLIGINTEKQKNEPLNNAAFSLDETITGKDGDQDTTRGELIEDNQAAIPFEEIDETAERQAIRESAFEALERLPKCQVAVQLVIFEGKSYRKAGAIIGVSGERVRQILNRAYRKLQLSQKFKEQAAEFGYYRKVSLNNFWNCGSVQEQYAEYQDRIKRQYERSLSRAK